MGAIATLNDLAGVRGIHDTNQRTGETFHRDLVAVTDDFAELIAAVEVHVRNTDPMRAGRLAAALARVGGAA